MEQLSRKWYWRGAVDKDAVAKEVVAMPSGGFLVRTSSSTKDAFVLTVNDNGSAMVISLFHFPSSFFFISFPPPLDATGQ